MGLKESKDAVDRYLAGERVTLPSTRINEAAFDTHGTSSGVTVAGHAIPAAAIEAMRRGQKMEAIKLLREVHPGLGLAQAKDLIEACPEQHNASTYSGLSTNGPAPSTSAASDPMSEPGRVPASSWRPSLFSIAILLLAIFGLWTFFKTF